MSHAVTCVIVCLVYLLIILISLVHEVIFQQFHSIPLIFFKDFYAHIWGKEGKSKKKLSEKSLNKYLPICEWLFND